METAEGTPEATKKNKKGRCALGKCKKKITLMGFSCRCGLRFCLNHLPAEVHQCTFDYQAEQQSQLSTSNPKVAPSKVDKI